MKHGYFGVGVERCKNAFNWGSLFRTANIFGASFIFTIGQRFREQASDTMRTERHLPLFTYKNIKEFNDNRPYNCKLIGVERYGSAHSLVNFIHPERCMYILGPEDGSLSRETISLCQDLVRIPGEVSLNLSVAGSIVLYDRIAKNGGL